jgi:hypothetical protein
MPFTGQATRNPQLFSEMGRIKQNWRISARQERWWYIAGPDRGTYNGPMSNEADIKQVKGKSVIVPTLEDVARLARQQRGTIETAPIRLSLAKEYGTQMCCPVTVRRHLKALGLL